MENARLYPVHLAPPFRGEVPEEARNGLGGQAVCRWLRQEHQRRGGFQREFLSKLRKVAAGLEELRSLQTEGTPTRLGRLDFAEELIAMDQLRRVAGATRRTSAPAGRLPRLQTALHTLSTARETYARPGPTIFISANIAEAFQLAEVFPEADLQITDGQVCARAKARFQARMEAFARTIAALRTGELLIAQTYEERLHDDYFDHFDPSYLTTDDLRYFPPVLVIAESRRLMREAADFLALFSNDGLVKVLGLNWLEELFDVETRDEPDYLELAALAIIRRNAYVFQGGGEQPFALHEAFQRGLAFPGPVLWNLLLPSRAMEHDPAVFFPLMAAAESRFFPRLAYEPQANHFESRHLDLQGNPAPEALFAPCEPRHAGMPAKLLFTPADFLALRAGPAIVPDQEPAADFLPLADYLAAAPAERMGKRAALLLVDENASPRRVTVPPAWLKACRDRLEYWSFLQSLAGIKPEQRQASAEDLRAEWEAAKAAELQSLKATLQAQFEEERAGDLHAAVLRMLNGLLRQNGDLAGTLTRLSREGAPAAPQPQAPPAGAPPKRRETAAEKARPPAPASTEAWVESDECTSCRDCIDALPAVFQYNDNKQAYVHNPQGAPFAKIVAAAEKCPPRCIHPGAPQNPAEPGLEQWVKRAEKYN